MSPKTMSTLRFTKLQNCRHKTSKIVIYITISALSLLQESHDGDMPFYFSFLTVMALFVFVREKVDVAILEVGIGGQYDSTNVVRTPRVCGITSLDLDHTSILGNTLEAIAWQKAGIFQVKSFA